MRKTVWMLLCALSTIVACAQSAKDAVNAFQASVGSSQLVLRNFSGEDDVRATWSGTDFELAAPRWRTVGILQVDSTKLKGHELTLACTRHVALVSQTNQLAMFPQPAKVEIRVDLASSDPTETLPKLKGALFYGSIKDALAAIPAGWQLTIPARTLARPKTPIDHSKPACDCATDDRTKCSADQREIGGITPPTVVRMKEPETPARASSSPRGGQVDISLKVDEAGRPQDVWVARSAGWGFDEEAARAVLAYEFHPAMCQTKPQTVYLNIDVQFRGAP